MGDKARGLYRKFDVKRTDGADKPGSKHHGCEYFVLDLTHDKFASKALGAYKEACADEYPILATELRLKIEEMERVKDHANSLALEALQKAEKAIANSIKVVGLLSGNELDVPLYTSALEAVRKAIAAAE